MSRWCHVSASIFGDTSCFESHSNLVKYVKKVLKKAPKITGSEGDLDVFVNAISGYSLWSSDGNKQNRVVITLAGDLRDTNYEQVTTELNEFLKFVETNVFINKSCIRSCVATIVDEYIDDPIVLWIKL